MANRKPLVLKNGVITELPNADTLNQNTKLFKAVRVGDTTTILLNTTGTTVTYTFSGEEHKFTFGSEVLVEAKTLVKFSGFATNNGDLTYAFGLGYRIHSPTELYLMTCIQGDITSSSTGGGIGDNPFSLELEIFP